MNINKDEIIRLIINKASNIVSAENEETNFDSNSIIFGDNTLFDSLGVVSLIVAVEQAIEDNYNISITLADEKAMSQKHSPFGTVGSLADYIMVLLDENINGF